MFLLIFFSNTYSNKNFSLTELFLTFGLVFFMSITVELRELNQLISNKLFVGQVYAN